MEQAGNKEQPAGTILLVDDEERNRKLLRRVLEFRNYKVREAADGEQALQSVQQEPPDTILLDVMMPKLDGFEVCRRLKADQEHCHGVEEFFQERRGRLFIGKYQ